MKQYEICQALQLNIPVFIKCKNKKKVMKTQISFNNTKIQLIELWMIIINIKRFRREETPLICQTKV